MTTDKLHPHDLTRILLEAVLKTVTDESQRVAMLVDVLDSLLSTQEAKKLPSLANYQARLSAARLNGFGELDLMNTIVDLSFKLTAR